ncbi:MAG: pyruvate kinase, partial [Reyranella sp.]|nr:pyruvate kinase [Reyranella sp.]
LGPATDAPGVLEALARSGMNVARVNLSHGEHAEHARRITQVREIARRLGEPLAVLADLPGPKFRVGELPAGGRRLEDGTRVALAIGSDAHGALPVRDSELLAALRDGEQVYLADGAIELRVAHTAPGRAECEVVAGGIVRSGSGINVPDSELAALIPTPADRRHLEFALSQQADWVGVSFVQSADDLARVRELLPPREAPLLMAKIEKRRALAALEAIVAAADGVMVARGDLGVETDLAEIPLVQKRIIAAANAAARPVVTATQMLESMVEHERPTRAEVTDVANSLLDGTDAVMLSAETAIGRFPVAAVGILQRVLAAAESEYAGRMGLERLRSASAAPADAVSFAACELAARLDARAIVAPVSDAAAALAIARLRPRAPLVAIVGAEALWRRLAMVRGVAPLLGLEATDPRACLEQARDWLFARGLAQRGDPAVLVFSADPAHATADSLRTVRLE